VLKELVNIEEELSKICPLSIVRSNEMESIPFIDESSQEVSYSEITYSM
jgi:hypothetical protein